MRMTSASEENPLLLRPLELIPEAELLALVDRIKASGELGRSPVYAGLLDFLVQCSIRDKTPKAIEIALEVLGKGADFDVGKDAAVRVYVHQLRKKLDSYFRHREVEAPFRIVIPKGQYAVAAIARQDATPELAGKKPWLERLASPRALLAVAILLLAANLLAALYPASSNDQPDGVAGMASLAPWSTLMHDDLPLLVVMGDYYIFGELNETGNIGRMIREFSINSPDDLEASHFSDWDRTHLYQDLDLSYIPEGSAYALARIVPILHATGKHIRVAMMSDLSTADLRGSHVIYIGYISAMDKLSGMVFAASGLRVGRSFDELVAHDSGDYFTSDAGLPESGQQFRDYGFFSTFPATSENQVIVIGGMRDAGLMYTAQMLSDAAALRDLEIELQQRSQAGAPLAAESLYEVYGVDRTHFDGNLVYSSGLDATQIWRHAPGETH